MSTPTHNPATNLHALLNRGEQVFSLHPQVTRYFPSAAMENARKRITRSIYRGDGPALVIGGAGTGKSLLLQMLAAQYHERFDVVLLACARICTRRALLQAILFELGLPFRERDEGQLRLSLLDHLLSVERSPTGLLLLVDEAQSLSLQLLDELRVMTNLVRGGVPRVRLVLAGSPTLEELFASAELESFSQRLAARCYLAPLCREETAQFVRAQVVAAGAGPESVFAADAWDSLFDATDGVARLVNQLCDRALLMAEAEDKPIIDRHAIQAAWADLQQLPTPWETSPRTSPPATGSHVIEFGSLEAGEASPAQPVAIEPTELDADEEVEIPASDAVSPQIARPNVAAAVECGAERAARIARSPANPFEEEFDEEEVVIDSFAAWDEIIHHGTPRVENQRERGMAALVRAAVDAHTRSEAACNESNVSEVTTRIAETTGSDRAGGGVHDDALGGRPRLRLADISDAPGDEVMPFRPATNAPLARSHDRHRAPAPAEDPVLVIEDDAITPKQAAPPVRRMAYQHLFSRLRSG